MMESRSKGNLDRLAGWFTNFESCIVAFSAGVDSSLLALTAKNALGNRAFAVTSLSPAFSRFELEEARKVAKEIGIELIEVSQDDLETPGYVKNEVNRCYFCRSNLAAAIAPVKNQFSVEICVDGTHVDDLKNPRPGVKALREIGFRAPYVELGLAKDSIREMARVSGLSNWNRPSESCLSSRIAYGQPIELTILDRIQKAEEVIKARSNARIVRVRTIGRAAMIEVEEPAIPSVFQNLTEITRNLRKLGYEKVSIDPEGYRSGKMLELFVKTTE